MLACAIFVILAALAHQSPYFLIDLTVTRALQRYQAPWFSALMFGLTWLGFMPQVIVLGSAVVVGLYLAGLRWEAAGAALAGVGGLIVAVVKIIVLRPRPSADLVRVLNVLNSASFPSGHVMQFTVFCGFLMYLLYTQLKPSWIRTGLLIFLGLVVALMGPSRIYLGQHWFSDAMGAYVLGSLWLVVTIQFYRWGKSRSTGVKE